MTAWNRFQRGQHERADRGAQDGHLEEVFAGPLFKLAPRSPSGPQPKCLCVVSLHPTGRQWKTPQGFFTFRQIFCWTKENGKGTEEEQEGHSQAAAAGTPQRFFLGPRNHANRVSVDQGTTLTGQSDVNFHLQLH